MYNNSNKDYLYIDTITDLTDSSLYSNVNITFQITGLEQYKTILMPGDEITIILTFSYQQDLDLNNNILLSKINFRFKEIPKYTLSNSNVTYNVDNAYPDYTPLEYQFTITNSDDTGINNVPLKYSFKTSIDQPLSIKIYDELGNEVTEAISLTGDGFTLEKRTFTAKIVWDNTNSDNELIYDSVDYANSIFNSSVILDFIPEDDEYQEFIINDDFNFKINSSSFNFNVIMETNIKAEKTASDVNMVINNYSSDTNYNIYDIEYDLSLQDNDKFTISISEAKENDGVISKILNGGYQLSDNYVLELAADIDALNITENVNLVITINEPYKTIIYLPLTLSLQPVTITLDPNGGNINTLSYNSYKGKNYPTFETPTWTGHTFNGWYTEKTGGTKITDLTEITTSNNHTLYAQWTSRLLVDNAEIGDYVNYPVDYSNVYTRWDGTLIGKSTYTGWRVVGYEGEGDERYVKLVSTGIPLVFRHPVETSGTTSSSVNALTTNFLSTPINSTVTNYNFIKSGFLTSTGSSTTSITQVSTLFNNQYTQTYSNGNPAVRSIIAEDIEEAMGDSIENLTDLRYSTLFSIPATTATSGYSYAGYYIATSYNTTYLWCSYYSGYVVYTSGTNGVRPVVLLKAAVEADGKDENGIWQLKI